MVILLVDTDPRAISKSAAALRIRYPASRIISMTDAMEAVRYSLNNPVDAVYTEVLMPRLSGLDVIRLVRKFHPDAKAYILSDTDEFADWVKEHGVGEHLFKRSIWKDERPSGRGFWTVKKEGERKMDEKKQDLRARELDEEELTQVAAAGSAGFSCGCGSTEYEVIYKRGGHPFYTVPYRKCKKCGRETIGK